MQKAEGGHVALLRGRAAYRLPPTSYRGFTLIELIVALGIFAIVMTLAAGGYLVIIGANRQAQASATSIDSLSFALETMTRDIRTGTHYHCGSPSGGDCSNGASSFYFTDSAGESVSYSLAGASGAQYIVKTVNGSSGALTDSASINVKTLTFFVSGTTPGDAYQPHATVVVTGSVSAGPGKTESFSVETGATMRGTDL